jgi:flavin-dependent dehydrogenase
MLPRTDTDIVLVGGGLAGCAAAITLARAGRAVHLLEREAAPQHKVCGEFLSHEALTLLDGLGIDLDSLAAEPLHAVRLAGRHRVSAAALPFPARSLTRRSLDAALLACAQSAGVCVHRGATVQTLQPAGERWQATLTCGESVTATHAILATGKHDLRGYPRAPGRQHDLIAFKMYFRLRPDQAAALRGHVELLLFTGGYAGLQPVEAGLANLCLVVRRSRYHSLGATWPALLAAITRENPHLHARLEAALPQLARPLAIAPIPYGLVRREAHDGLFRLGDQAAVIPSFTGDGMSLALHSGTLAAHSLLAGESSAAFQQKFARQVSAQVSLSTWISRALVRAPLQRLAEVVASSLPAILPSIAAGTRLRAVATRQSAVAPVR